MQQRDVQRLAHICDYCEDMEKYLAAIHNDYSTFLSDSMCQHSVAFCVLQIGELVSKLSDELRTETANEINWAAIKGMRNIVVHDYGHIDLEVLWSVAKEDAPVLKRFCQKFLSQQSD